MQIAILGATSMLAADYAATAIKWGIPHELTLFARDPARARAAMLHRDVAAVPKCEPLDRFTAGRWDAIINFIGVGDPARAAMMGADILSITRTWDDRVLGHLEEFPNCRYLFLSSGAVYGTGTDEPAGTDTPARFPINALGPSSWYGISKFYAEAVHRSASRFSIIDIRIFNYLGEWLDLDHRFFVNEMIAAVLHGRTLGIDGREMVRDYLSREDLATLIAACLDAPPGWNGGVDAHSRSSITKTEMLTLFRDRYGLHYEPTGGGVDATGTKSVYWSRNTAAAALGYRPCFDSAETLTGVTDRVLARHAGR